MSSALQRGTSGSMHPSANLSPVMLLVKDRRPNTGRLAEKFCCKALIAILIIGSINTVVGVQYWPSGQQQDAVPTKLTDVKTRTHQGHKKT